MQNFHSEKVRPNCLQKSVSLVKANIQNFERSLAMEAKNMQEDSCVQTPLLNVPQAAARTGLTPYVIRKLCETNQIQAYRILGQWRISELQLDKYMLRHLNVAR